MHYLNWFGLWCFHYRSQQIWGAQILAAGMSLCLQPCVFKVTAEFGRKSLQCRLNLHSLTPASGQTWLASHEQTSTEVTRDILSDFIDFGSDHVRPGIHPLMCVAKWLCVNSDPGWGTACGGWMSSHNVPLLSLTCQGKERGHDSIFALPALKA